MTTISAYFVRIEGKGFRVMTTDGETPMQHGYAEDAEGGGVRYFNQHMQPRGWFREWIDVERAAVKARRGC
jgi:hypothetical protein